MKKLFFIVAVLLFNLNRAQTASWQKASKEEIISSYKKVCDWFIKTQDYSFALKYTSFKDHVSDEIVESSEGFYKRAGSKFRMEAIGMKTIQNEKIKIIIDTADHVIALTDPATLSPTMQNPEELIKMLEYVKALKKRTTGKSTTYRIDFKKNELYDAYEFTISDKGLLEKLVYYYAEQVEKEYGDGEKEKPYDFKVKPRMEIAFSNHSVPAKFIGSEFSDKSIVLANNKVSLLDKYKNYQIKDYRTPSK